MQIANILSNYKAEAPMRDTGWRSQELKDKAVELRLKGNSLLEISELLFIHADTAAKWCKEIKNTYQPLPTQIKNERKCEIIQLLKVNPALNNFDLASKLGVTTRTIRSDIKSIKG